VGTKNQVEVDHTSGEKGEHGMNDGPFPPLRSSTPPPAHPPSLSLFLSPPSLSSLFPRPGEGEVPPFLAILATCVLTLAAARTP
jgi:hypothetical protein